MRWSPGVVVTCCLAGCGSDGEWKIAQLGLGGGQLTTFVIDATDAPVIAANGFFRWSGSSWEQLSLDGITTGVSGLWTDRARGLLAGGLGSIYRQAPGASSWELLHAGSPPLYPPLVQSSDGTYYAFGPHNPVTGLMRAYYRGPADPGFVDSGADAPFISSTVVPQTDASGNLWFDSADEDIVRVNRNVSERYPKVWQDKLGDAYTTIAVDSAGDLIGANVSYVSTYGQVLRWRPGGTALEHLTTGANCDDNGTLFACDPSNPTTLGGQALQPHRAANGDIFELYAEGAQASNANVFRLAAGSNQWQVILDTHRDSNKYGDPSGGVGLGYAIYSDSKSRVYLVDGRNSQVFSLDPP